MFSRHVTKDISAYCHGELSSEASKQFAEHIIACGKCRTKFEEVKRGIKLAEQLPTLSAPDRLWRDLEPLLGTQAETPSVARGSWHVRVAAAAVVLLVASMGVWWLFKKGQAPSVSVTLRPRSEEHTSELQSQSNLVCRLLLEKKKKK